MNPTAKVIIMSVIAKCKKVRKRVLFIMHFISEHEYTLCGRPLCLSMQLLYEQNIYFSERTIHGLCKINFTVQCEMGCVVNCNKEQIRVKYDIQHRKI